MTNTFGKQLLQQCRPVFEPIKLDFNLVVAAIILWNTVYLERAIGALRQQGRQVDEGLLKHVAPVHCNHINLTGDYSWRQNKHVEKGGFRPLRISPEP